MARTVNLIENHMIGDIIDVKSPGGRSVALKLSNASVEAHADFQGDRLKGLVLDVKLSSSISETHDEEDVTGEEAVAFLCRQQSDVIRNRLISVIEKSRETKTDFLRLSRFISLKHPGKWQKMKAYWPEVLAEVSVDIRVSANIGRSYDIYGPLVERGWIG